jgi:ribose transport system ATP-binding protein
MHDSDAPIINIQGITKQFPGVMALDNVSFSIAPRKIHAVIGENGAGKTTLMNILAGELQPSAGQIIYKGKPQQIVSAHMSQQLGISVVYQELALCPNLSIAENIALTAAGKQFALAPTRKGQYQQRAREIMARLGMDNVSMQRLVGQLTIAQQQMVELARAISVHAEVLILDEPNSALSKDETERLFEILRQLRAEGVTIIYISHRLEEVMSLADRITILRDGRYVDTLDAADATIETLIGKMVGRTVDSLFERKIKPQVQEKVVFEVKDLTSGRAVQNVSFAVFAGEVVGIAGLPDAGKDELVECAFGLRPYDRGTILVNGQPARIKSAASAIRHGLAFIPADRRASGVISSMTVQDNLAAASLKTLSRFGFLNRPAVRKMCHIYVEQLDIRLSNLGQPVSTLSGGNQQKVILARGLATRPSILLLHEPTRGIDVGAKAEIYTILQQLALQGAGIVIVSSELPELLSQCDRILVMHAGRLTGDFTQIEATEEGILACAMGRTTHLPGAAYLN